jgi:hypothetical protein
VTGGGHGPPVCMLKKALANLADMRNLASYNDGHSFILTCIDAFSRFGFAVPIRDKRGTTVAIAFDKILAERVPTVLQTDRGVEFLNSQVVGLELYCSICIFHDFEKIKKESLTFMISCHVHSWTCLRLWLGNLVCFL